MWMIAGIAGGIQPWWHYVGAYHEDRRMYPHAGAGDALVARERRLSRRPHAGRERRPRLVAAEHRLLRARRPGPARRRARTPASCTRWSGRAIPYLPVHVDDIDATPGGLSVLILPNVGALSDAQVGVDPRVSCERGGSLARDGADEPLRRMGRSRAPTSRWPICSAATWLAMRARRACAAECSEVRAAARSHRARAATPTCGSRRSCAPAVDGPKAGDEPAAAGSRHPVLRGFDETDILAFGGTLARIESRPGRDRAR